MTLRQLVEESREVLLSSPDSVCLERAQLVTETYRKNPDLPVPLLRATAFAYVLDNMSLDLASNPVFAGNTSSRPRAWMLLPEYGFSIPNQALIENPSLEGHLDGEAVPKDIRDFWKERSAGGNAGIGHLTINNRMLLAEGLSGVLKRAERVRDQGNTRQLMIAESTILSCRAVIRWAHRYADQAEGLAKRTTDESRKKALLRVSQACHRVPAESARNFFEALQSLVLVYLAIHIEGHGYSVSPGRLDQDLAPYFSDDEDSDELLDAFLLKFASNSVWGSHSKTQCITLGGANSQGHDMGNALTMRFLEASERMRIPDPHLFVRWHGALSEEVRRKSLDMLTSHCGMPMFVGDQATVQGLIGAGVTPEDAWNYCIIGCNELGIPGKMIYDSITINGLVLLRNWLIDEADSDCPTMDALMEGVKTRLAKDVSVKVSRLWNARPKHRKKVPTPFTSSLMDGCLEQGLDLTEGIAYRIPVVTERGFSNLVNALTAIERRVFEEQSFSLLQLRDAVQADFVGFEWIQQSLQDAPKWGTEEERPEHWAQRWLSMRDRVQRKVEAQVGTPKHLMAHVVRSLHHLDGRALGTTPDGRLGGTPLAASVGVQQGTVAEPPAIAYCVSKMNASEHWSGGYNFNLSLPVSWGTAQGYTESLLRLIDFFFSSGGQELQLNFLDPKLLRKALENPEQYPHLLFRVAGFCGRFTNLSEGQQQELLERAETAARPVMRKRNGGENSRLRLKT